MIMFLVKWFLLTIKVLLMRYLALSNFNLFRQDAVQSRLILNILLIKHKKKVAYRLDR